MNIPRCALGVAVSGNYLYALGGHYRDYYYGSGYQDSVERSAINADGSLGPWQGAGTMTTPRAFFATVAVGGYLYAIGGTSSDGIWLNTIERAAINADGSLGPWQVISMMTSPRSHHAAVAVNGYLYILGGWNGSSVLDSVERASTARHKSFGSLGRQRTTGICPLERFGHCLVEVGDELQNTLPQVIH